MTQTTLKTKVAYSLLILAVGGVANVIGIDLYYGPNTFQTLSGTPGYYAQNFLDCFVFYIFGRMWG